MKCRTINNTKTECSRDEIPVDEIWGTYHFIARDIKRRLIAFRKLDKHGYPPTMSGELEWNETIDRMIKAFSLLSLQWTVQKENREAVSDGLQLFHQYFEYLRD